MIKIIKRVTASAIWHIEGKEVTLQYRKEYPEEMMAAAIKSYREFLVSKAYIHDNTELCKAFNLFGGIAFVAVGMTVKKAFFECFTHYARMFTKEWALGDKCLCSKYVGYSYAFEVMLRNENYPIKYDFRYILDGVDESNKFSLIIENVFLEYWSGKMLVRMKDGLSVGDIAARVGDARVSRYFMSMERETEIYLKKLAADYTEKREIISKRNLADYIFKNNGDSKFLGIDESFHKLFVDTVNKEFERQKIKYVAENKLEFNKDIWKLYEIHGITLKYMIVDFSKVKAATLRQELKCFFKDRFSYSFKTSDRNVLYLLNVANTLCEINPQIRFFADVSIADAKALQLKLENEVSQVQVMNIISMCTVLFDFLCSDDNKSRLPKPASNPFHSLKMVNAQKYNKNTPYIPDAVVNQLEQNIDKLSPIDSRMFKIFAATGMRAKEVAFLKEDCLSKGRYEQRYILKYIPYKVLNARRKHGIGDYHQIYVDKEIKVLIEEQIKDSQELRNSCGQPYIFLYQNKGRKICMPNTGNYCARIKKLIEKCNICDDNGTSWNFTTRQCRKTIVMKMIENNATVVDLVYLLGHLNYATVMRYYAEVKAMKLAELNTEFYQKQFGLLLSQEKLTDFTEEERKLLYVDFRLSKRRVEFGYCMRKFSEGACEYGNKTVHCANCPNLCTGKQYLSYWVELLNSQSQVIAALMATYEKENITKYDDFAEYILENRKYMAYKNVVKWITEAENECDI